MPNAPARKSGKERVGTVDCPLSETVCDVFEVRLGNRHAQRLYYRGPAVGTIQCYGPSGQAWLRKNMRKDKAEPEKQPAAEPVQQPAAQPEKQPAQQPAAQPENDERARLILALGAA